MNNAYGIKRSKKIKKRQRISHILYLNFQLKDN